MPIKTKYLFVASMDVDPEKEALFHEVYDTEHVPNLLKVPGVHAVARLEGEPFAMSIGGEERRVTPEGPRHTAIYEIDGPQVLISRGMGQGGRSRPLAQRGAAVHPQPAPCALSAAVRRHGFQHVSWPGLSRPSRSRRHSSARLSEMPGTRPGMTAR